MHTVNQNYESREIMSVKQLAAHPRYRWLTESALRHMIFEASPRFNSKAEEIPGNGLDCAILRLNRRVLIDVEAFDDWLRSHRSAAYRS